jgi:uncharacterized protein
MSADPGRSNEVRDLDLEDMSREDLAMEVKKLRKGIRIHRDSSGHELCWHHPDLWALLPEESDPLPEVPAWPEFMRGCIRYRQSLDSQVLESNKDGSMEPRITVLTLGVDNLERATAFYRDALGFPTQGAVGTEFEHGAVAFFDLQSGLKLALWRRADLAHDTGLPSGARSSTEFSLGHNVRTRAEVDDLLEEAARGGAEIVKPGQETFWGGYSGYFKDPDGHLWEVVWNPELLPDT